MPSAAPGTRGESRAECLKRRRKSSWWAEAFQRAGPPASGCRWIYIADRESDFYEPIQTCQRSAVDFIIRAGQDRRLAQEVGKLRAALAQAPVLGQSTVELRSRGGEPARTAIVELRSVPVDLDGPWRPGGWQEPLRGVTALEVCEVSCAGGGAGTAALDSAHQPALPDLGGGAAHGRAVYGAMVGGRIS